jgi:hypothetical protein
LKIVTITQSYSWIDCLSKNKDIASAKEPYTWQLKKNNTMCDGYIQNYTYRQDPYILNVSKLSWLTDLNEPIQLCKKINSTNEKKLNVNSNDTIYFSYFENGHNSIWTSKNTLWTIYWNKKSNTEIISNDITQLKSDPFDNGICGSTLDNRTGDLYPCVSNFTIPNVTETGFYQFIWYWPIKSLKYAFYSCFDVYIISNTTQQNTTTPDYNTTAIPTTVIPTTLPNYNTTYNNSQLTNSTIQPTNMTNINNTIPIMNTTVNPIINNTLEGSINSVIKNNCNVTNISLNNVTDYNITITDNKIVLTIPCL